MTTELPRVLTLRDLVLIVVGTTIGSGIFTVPGSVLRQSGGDLGVALVVWVVGSVLALLGALTFGELGAMLPHAGGSYVYVREAFGPLPAFLLVWTLFLTINTGSTAKLAVAVANYLTANAGYVAAVGASGVAATDRIAADVVQPLFGPAAAKLVTLVILISIFSAANGLALTGPRM